jgi:hypothetical protein
MQSANCNCLPETAAPKHRLALYGEVVTKNGG